MKTVAVVVGTRPEAIKMAPVVQALARSHKLRPLTLSTSQHAHLVHQVFGSFGITCYHDLRVMREAQTLWDLSSRLAARLGRFLDRHRVDAVLVQGDTTTALFGGLCAFYHHRPVGHVEAGLRTGNRASPFPEEMNRRLLAALATWHFAPTREAARRLRREGVPARSIFVTGNTVVDALRWMAPRCDDAALGRLLGAEGLRRRLVLVTCHRRESLGEPLRRVARALAELARRHADVVVLLPVHPNPAVRRLLVPALRPVSNVVLCAPLDYAAFLACLRRAWLVISDSGGVQEEATALGKPVLVLRNETERPEGVRAGALKLVGTDAERIVRAASRLLQDPTRRRQMGRAATVFGDGRAAPRLVRILERELIDPAG